MRSRIMSFMCARCVYLRAPRRWRTIGREQGARRRWGERPLTRGAADDAQRRWGPRATATWCSRRCVRKTVGQPPQQGVEGCAAWIVCESEFHSGSGAEGAAGPARTAGPVRGLGSEAVVGLVERREAQVRRGPGAACMAGRPDAFHEPDLRIEFCRITKVNTTPKRLQARHRSCTINMLLL